MQPFQIHAALPTKGEGERKRKFATASPNSAGLSFTLYTNLRSTACRHTKIAVDPPRLVTTELTSLNILKSISTNINHWIHLSLSVAGSNHPQSQTVCLRSIVGVVHGMEH